MSFRLMHKLKLISGQSNNINNTD